MAPRGKGIADTDKIRPIVLRDGYIHLHLVQQRQKNKNDLERRYEWVVRERQHPDICGTVRCVYLKIEQNQSIPDHIGHEHRWGMPDKPTFKCRDCGVFAEADMAVREVKKAVAGASI